MKCNLNNNQDLINLFNTLFQHKKLVKVAPSIMNFFIITRNFGLLNYKDNIIKLMNGANPNELALEVIKDGFQKKNIPFNDQNLIALLITNYHDKGFYFHSFPGIYKNSIMENGILASNRNIMDDSFFAIVNKYHFGDYFSNSNNRVCVSEKVGIPYTNEYATLTPEWLYEFLKQGNGDITDAYITSDINKLDEIAQNALSYFKSGMERNPEYDEKDYLFLCEYIKDIVDKRFSQENNVVNIALIEKEKSDEYFEKHYQKKDIPTLIDKVKPYAFSSSDILYFIVESLSKGIVTTDKNIPKELLNIISYEITTNEIKQNKAIK